jgi:hypothetical protein
MLGKSRGLTALFERTSADGDVAGAGTLRS